MLDLTMDLKKVMTNLDPDEAMDELYTLGLDWVAQIVKYDLAAIFELQDGQLVLRAQRGRLSQKRLQNHTLEVNRFPTIRNLMKSRKAKALQEHDHAQGEGDPFDGVLDLPHGHSCMVVPLCGADTCFGVMTLDRAVCQSYDADTVKQAETFGFLLGLSLSHLNDRLAYQRLAEQERLRFALDQPHFDAGDFDQSQSHKMRQLYQKALQVAPTNAPVLLTGETGTGKERLANALHRLSLRSERPFVAINCAAIPEALLESELFGHKKGAFTGAQSDRAGRFQTANGGTLFLDEIGEMPMTIQAKLLRVLQEGTFQPVGSDKTVKVDVRIMAATHKNLLESIQRKDFREDLYYRLNVFPLNIPPLRERLEDLPLLAAQLLIEIGKRLGRPDLTMSRAAFEKCEKYYWPGNVRELGNLLERAAILTRGSLIDARHIVLEPSNPAPETPIAKEEVESLDEAISKHILKALEKAGGKIYGAGGAAEILDMKPTTLQSKMRKLGIQKHYKR